MLQPNFLTVLRRCGGLCKSWMVRSKWKDYVQLKGSPGAWVRGLWDRNEVCGTRARRQVTYGTDQWGPQVAVASAGFNQAGHLSSLASAALPWQRNPSHRPMILFTNLHSLLPSLYISGQFHNPSVNRKPWCHKYICHLSNLLPHCA